MHRVPSLAPRIVHHVADVSSPVAARHATPSAPASGVAPAYGHHLASLAVSPSVPIQCTRKPKNAYTLAKRVLGKAGKRSDKAELEAHFDAIERHFTRFKLIHDKSARLAAKHRLTGNLKLERSNAKKARAALAKMTEAIGEMNATNKILRDRKAWRLLSGFSAGVGIDQIWRTGAAGKFNIVEAKGPGAKLGVSDAKGAQMSREWVMKTLAGMKNDYGITNALGKKIPKVRGYIITSTATGKTAQKKWLKRWYN